MHDSTLQKSLDLESFLRDGLSKNNPWQLRRHLVDTKDLSKDEALSVIKLAELCKKYRAAHKPPLSILNNRIVATVFYENSTRTKTSFDLAAKLWGATVVNLDVATSSTAKGETLIDTTQTLISMGVDLIIQRHSTSGAAQQLAQQFDDQVQFISAGDGSSAHPTQALLDLFTMMEVRPDMQGAKVAIIGDITHSRVARSNLWLLKQFGVDVHVAGPASLIPPDISSYGVTVHNKLESAIKDCDFVMTLRIQQERQKQGLISSLEEYTKLYQLNHDRIALAKPNVKVLHPGPMNRGIEISNELADDRNISLINTQVKNGVAVRMAIIYLLLGTKELQ